MSESGPAGIIVRSKEEWAAFASAVLGNKNAGRLFPAPASYPVAVALPLVTVAVAPITRWIEAKDWPPGMKDAADTAPFDAAWVEKLYDDMRAFVAERNASVTSDFTLWLERRRAAAVTARLPAVPGAS